MNDLADLDLLLSVLRARATEPGRRGEDGAVELAKFIEDLERALLHCKLLSRSQPVSSWHADPNLKPHNFHSSDFQDLHVAYGKRTKGAHANEGGSISRHDVESRFSQIRIESQCLIARCPQVLDALFDVQTQDVPQQLARDLTRILLAMGQDVTDLAASQARLFLGPVELDETDSAQRLRRLLRRVGAKRGTARDHPLVTLARRISASFKSPELDMWLRQAVSKLQLADDTFVESGGRRRFQVVRMRLDWVPGARVRLTDVVFLEPKELIPPEVRSRLFPREALAAELDLTLTDVLSNLSRALGRTSLRWSQYVVQLDLPRGATYAELDPRVDERFRAVTLRPRMSRMPFSTDELGHPDADPTTVALETPVPSDELRRQLRDAVCLFAAPSFVDPKPPETESTCSCPAVAAFERHELSLAVCFHDAGLGSQIDAVFRSEQRLHIGEALERIHDLRCRRPGRVTVLWDDPEYEEHVPEAMA